MKTSQASASKRIKYIILSVAALLVVAAVLAGAVYFLMTKEGPLDKITMCPAKGPKGHVILLVDKTDPLNFTQRQAFVTLLEELAERGVEPGHLLSVFVLGEDYKETAKPVFERCNPGKGEGKSELTDNIAKLQKQFRESFREPMLMLADALQATQSAKASPIFEMIQLASINGYRKHAIDGPRRFVMVSDMLHNTPQFSMYRGIADFRAFQSSDYGKKMQADLKGVQVELHYVMNTPQLQTLRHLKFWEDYFSNAGARLVAVRPMEG